MTWYSLGPSILMTGKWKRIGWSSAIKCVQRASMAFRQKPWRDQSKDFQKRALYRDLLEDWGPSYARMTEQYYILQAWNSKKQRLKCGRFQHVFRMPDADGNIVASCDFPDFKNTYLCFHIELVERYGLEMMPEPLHEGEEPDSFLLSSQNRRLFFSVATSSVTESRYSQQRTIVQCWLDVGPWRCNSCPQQN